MAGHEPAIGAPPAYEPSRRTLATLRNLAALGAIVFLVGLAVAPRQAWAGYLMGFVYLTGLAVAGPFFLAVTRLAEARWVTVLRRVPEAMCANLLPAAALGVFLWFGVSSLYAWSHPATVEADPLLAAKASYLNVPGFALRLALAFALWILIARRMVRASREQDRGIAHPRQARHELIRAASFLLVFAVTWSLASVDWVMSLEPHWFSTIFALRTLSGLALAGLAAATVVIVFLRRGPLRGFVSDEHFHDLGRLLFTLSVVWVYLWYCEYMLIWYTNIPEEAVYYAVRRSSGWRVLNFASLAANWAIPFLVLLPRATRRSGSVLLRLSFLILAGHAVELYLMIGPGIVGEHPAPGPFEIVPLLGAVCLFFHTTLRALTRAPLVPVGDERLRESLAHHA